jgi:glutamine synthetase
VSATIESKATARSVMERVKAEELEYVRCQFIDLSGILRGRAVHRRYLPSVLDKGIPFAQVNNTVDIDDAESDLTIGSQAGDFWAVPDPGTLCRVPHTKASGQMFADLVAADGSVWPTCGRAVVRRVNALVERELGTVALGFEQEGYVLRKTETGYEPVVVGKQMQPETLDRLDAFVTDLTPALELMGVPVEKLTAEGGWGMFEVNFEQAPPLEAAERWFRYKQAFRIVAREHGMVGSFMPKPFADGVGAGLHVHVSCMAGDEDVLGAGLPGNELTQRGRWFLGGLLEHAPALVALGSPTVNSFKRLRAGTWAPTHVAYGAGNRSAMVRIVQGRTNVDGRPGVRRLEIRSPDGTCNPYLLAAGVLAAGLDGLRRRRDPGPPVTYDIAHPEATGGTGEAAPPRLPKTLDAALDGLEADGPLRDLLGPALVDAYIKVKRIEWAKFMNYVTDWEHRYYAEFY